eukprot:355127-Chlamydomonas_euryale.AAC.2
MQHARWWLCCIGDCIGFAVALAAAADSAPSDGPAGNAPDTQNAAGAALSPAQLQRACRGTSAGVGCAAAPA